MFMDTEVINSIQIYSEVVMFWTSLVVQWLRIHLPVQGSWVQVLVQEDSTWCGAAWPVQHSP